MKWALRILAVTLVAVIVTQVVPRAWAAVDGRYRIELMDGRYVEGDVKELPDGSYEVKTKHGAVVTIKKNQVRAMRSLEETTARSADAPAAAMGRIVATRRQPISEAEIQEVLSGIVATPDAELTGVARTDMLAPLPLDEKSLEEMLKEAGGDRQKNVLVKEHFVMVYTSTEQSAKDLGTRLEAVWRWNVKFMDMMKVPARRPAHKLELFYFGTWDEFEAYSRNRGSALPPGVLGYYSPDINRSHFFDLKTSPMVAPYLEALKQPGVPWTERQRITNRINRVVEFQNIETIQHETGHHIHFNIGLFPRDAFGGGSVPIWLVEGTTMMFEVPPSKAGASLGALNHYRLFHLRATFGPHPLDHAEWKLFLIDNNLWANAAGHGNVADSYQLGWSMVYYLWKEHREGYAKYLQKIFGREAGETVSTTEREKEFEDVFGRVDKKWVEDYYKFLDSLQLRPSLLPPGEREAAESGVGRQASPGSGGGGRGRRP